MLSSRSSCSGSSKAGSISSVCSIARDRALRQSPARDAHCRRRHGRSWPASNSSTSGWSLPSRCSTSAVDIDAILAALWGRFAKQHDHLPRKRSLNRSGCSNAVGHTAGSAHCRPAYSVGLAVPPLGRRGDRFVVQPARHQHVEIGRYQIGRPDPPTFRQRRQARQPHARALHVRVGIEHLGRRTGKPCCPATACWKAVQAASVNSSIARIAGMNAVGRPELSVVVSPRGHALVANSIASPIGRRDSASAMSQMGIAAFHAVELAGRDVPEERKDDLHDRALWRRARSGG